MKRNPLTIGIGLILIVIFALLLFLFQVRVSSVAVVTFFGKPVRVVTQPGPYFRWPWPIEQVFYLDQRIQNFESKFEPTTLPDQNIINLWFYTGWKISDPQAFFPRFPGDNVRVAETTLEGMLRTAMKDVAGRHNFPDFISADPAVMKFTNIEAEVQQALSDKVKQSGYGIEIAFVQIKRIGLPESVTKDVFDRMASERAKVISYITNQAAADAIRIKAVADNRASASLSQADAAANSIKGEGEKAAMESLAIFQSNPALAAFLLKKSVLEQMTNRVNWVLDAHNSPIDVIGDGLIPSTNAVAKPQ